MGNLYKDDESAIKEMGWNHGVDEIVLTESDVKQMLKKGRVYGVSDGEYITLVKIVKDEKIVDKRIIGIGSNPSTKSPSPGLPGCSVNINCERQVDSDAD